MVWMVTRKAGKRELGFLCRWGCWGRCWWWLGCPCVGSRSSQAWWASPSGGVVPSWLGVGASFWVWGLAPQVLWGSCLFGFCFVFCFPVIPQWSEMSISPYLLYGTSGHLFNSTFQVVLAIFFFKESVLFCCLYEDSLMFKGDPTMKLVLFFTLNRATVVWSSSLPGGHWQVPLLLLLLGQSQLSFALNNGKLSWLTLCW